MSTAAKVALVDTVREEHGLAAALNAVSLPKATWYYHQRQKVSYETKYAHVKPALEAIAREHPEYGYRRIAVELRETYDLAINHKVVPRLLQTWRLALPRHIHAPKPSGIRQAIADLGEYVDLVTGREDIGLFEVAYTDFTELIFADGTRKAYLMPIIGHGCKVAYGWAVGLRANTALALTAWERAKALFATYDIPYHAMIVHHDRDPVYTGYGWAAQLLGDGVRLSYALRGAKDNPLMESFNGRFKGENRSLFLDVQTRDELILVVDQRMSYYNTERRHSSLGYLSPLTYLERVRAGLIDVDGGPGGHT